MIPHAKIRGFEVAKGWEGFDVRLPVRATEHSAGYDFFVVEDVVIWPNKISPTPILIPTGIKAYMRPDELLVLANRSSNPKRGLLLANGIGVIDADFFSNESNDGHIMFSFWNVSDQSVILKRGDKLGQGIFMTFMRADGDTVQTQRTGGFGSSDVTD